MITDIPRSTPRQVWKSIYRQYRIVRRESNKAFLDMVIYGSGAVRTASDVSDGIAHVPIQDLIMN